LIIIVRRTIRNTSSSLIKQCLKLAWYCAVASNFAYKLNTWTSVLCLHEYKKKMMVYRINVNSEHLYVVNVICFKRCSVLSGKCAY
jgi:hypothetical protein